MPGLFVASRSLSVLADDRMKEDEAKNAHNAEADNKRLPEAVR